MKVVSVCLVVFAYDADVLDRSAVVVVGGVPLRAPSEHRGVGRVNGDNLSP